MNQNLSKDDMHKAIHDMTVGRPQSTESPGRSSHGCTNPNCIRVGDEEAELRKEMSTKETQDKRMKIKRQFEQAVYEFENAIKKVEDRKLNKEKEQQEERMKVSDLISKVELDSILFPESKELSVEEINNIVVDTCDEIKDMLCKKNISYGAALYKPMGIFSSLSAKDACRVRIDDKLSRLKRGSEYKGENDIRDLIGYLIGMLVIEKIETPETSNPHA